MVVFIIFLFLFFFAKKAEAIVFLPAIILIPIAHIVAFIISGLSVPVLGASALIAKLKGKSLSKTLIVGFTFLIILAIVIAFILGILNPQRPLF